MTLLEAARVRTILMDGAMGTQLQRAGLVPGDCGEAWNLERAELVVDIQERYRDAGAAVLLTNTFGGSRIALARHGLAGRAAEINRAGAALARRVAGPDHWVLGDIGPFGGFLQPLGGHHPHEVRAAFQEQASALLEGGADGILIETMSALDELELAVHAAHDAGAPFICASLTYDATPVGPRTMMGISPEAAATLAARLGVSALGANCGSNLDIAAHADVLRRYCSVTPDLLLLSRPNAGTPRLQDDSIWYDLEPAEFASRLSLLVHAGATLVGGCCGTTPDHIAAASAALTTVSSA